MTGKDNGALVFMERFFGRLLLWLACRHHIGELLLKDACLINFKGSSTSPDVVFLKDLKDLWDKNGDYFYFMLNYSLKIIFYLASESKIR